MRDARLRREAGAEVAVLEQRLSHLVETGSLHTATAIVRRLNDPASVREIAFFCDDRSAELAAAVPPGRRTDALDELLFDYEEVWYTCVERLARLGRAGDPDAVEELWAMSTSGRYDAGYSEALVTAISKIGPLALPFLENVRGPEEERAKPLIEAISEGRILE